MRVLVTFGSKMGGTAGIARTIGDALGERGIEADVRPANEVRKLDGYDAAIVGGGLYAGRWQRDARRFVKRFGKELLTIPVWMFSSGPLDDSATRSEIPPTRTVRASMDRVGARGHATFGGCLRADAKGLIASKMAKRNAGDWRDQEHVRAWAAGVSDELLMYVSP